MSKTMLLNTTEILQYLNIVWLLSVLGGIQRRKGSLIQLIHVVSLKHHADM
jgi:hypothetical protein